MRMVGRVIFIAVLAFLAFRLAGWALGVLVGTVVFGLRIALVAAIIAAVVYGYRRVTRKSRRRRRAETPALGSGSLDWAFIRGRLDEETYLRNRRAGR